MNAINLLKSQHQQLIAVMQKLEHATDNNPEQCNELFNEFKRLYHKHDKLEDEIFYPVLLKTKETRALGLKAYQAHHVAEVGILELKLLPFNSENWGPKFSVVKDNILTHIQQEEEIIFPKAEANLNDNELTRIASEMEMA